jgi:hypothetical protein
MKQLVETAQRKAASVVGLTYLFINLVGLFNEIFVRGRVLAADGADGLARGIANSETLFRLSIAIDLGVFLGDITLAVAFYVLLRRVHRPLALAGMCFRLADGAILGAFTFCSFVALRLVAHTDYLQVFSPGQLNALAKLFIGVQRSGYFVGLTFLCVSSTCTSFLLLKSRLVPRFLAMFGIVASLLLALSPVIVVFPAVANIAIPYYYLPIVIFELVLGAWLVIRKIPVEMDGVE